MINTKYTFYVGLIVLCAVIVLILLAEAIARVIEPKTIVEGVAHHYVAETELGWLPSIGRAKVTTPEFTAIYDVNPDRMNDKPIGNINNSKKRIVAIGDSHTYAIGVSQQETWPNVLEAMLFNGDERQGTVYNLGVTGYSLGQYYLRVRQMRNVLKPHIVVVGFSMATDLYDLIPPRKGGFVYGEEFGRAYFDLTIDGILEEKRELVGKTLAKGADPEAQNLSGTIIRIIKSSALYNRVKRSSLAFFIAAHVKPDGQALWPGLDTALKIELNDDDKYRWTLADRLIGRIASDSKKNKESVVLVNIPYLPQVYDEIWESSFGKLPEKYSRFIASSRLRDICEKHGVHFVDTTHDFVNTARALGTWLHHKHDGHPNVEGQRLIATTLKNSMQLSGIQGD